MSDHSHSERVHKFVIAVYEDLGLEGEDLTPITRGEVFYYSGQGFKVKVESPDGIDFQWEGTVHGSTPVASPAN